MKTFDYIVNRDDIYVGIVEDVINKEFIKYYENGIYDFDILPMLGITEENLIQEFDNCRHLIDKVSHLSIEGKLRNCTFARTIIFILDENSCANDLLYDSPHYPIFNISDDNECLNAEISIKTYAYKIGKLLEYYGYPEKLTIKEIICIRDNFFTDYALDNCELFGIHETGPNETAYSTWDTRGNYRTFNLHLDDGILPKCYWYPFWFGRCSQLSPCKEEGDIKSLETMFLNSQNETKRKTRN